MTTYAGGCRASIGGLHLGHVYGCFNSVKVNPEDSYFFVLSDCLSQRQDAVDEAVVDLALDARSVGIEGMRIIRESAIRKELAVLTGLMERAVPYRLLEEAHPHHRLVKEGAYRGSLSDFLFPLHQSAYLIGLGVDVACYNDDNERFVALTRKCARRVNVLFESNLPSEVEIIKRVPGRLAGWDGRRMAKANNNCLFLAASMPELVRFFKRMVGRSGESGQSAQGVSEVEMAYLQIAGVDDATRDYAAMPWSLRIAFLAEAMWQVLSTARERRRILTEDGSVKDIVDSIRLEEQVAHKRIKNVMSNAGLR